MAGLRVSGNKNVSCQTSQACSEFWPFQNNSLFAGLSMHHLSENITEESRPVCAWIATLSVVFLVCEQGSKHWRLVKTMDWVKFKWPSQGGTQKVEPATLCFWWQHIRFSTSSKDPGLEGRGHIMHLPILESPLESYFLQSLQEAACPSQSLCRQGMDFSFRIMTDRKMFSLSGILEQSNHFSSEPRNSSPASTDNNCRKYLYF